MSDPRTRKLRELGAVNAKLRSELLDVLRWAVEGHHHTCVCRVCRLAHAHGVVYRQALDRKAPIQMRLA